MARRSACSLAPRGCGGGPAAAETAGVRCCEWMRETADRLQVVSRRLVRAAVATIALLCTGAAPGAAAAESTLVGAYRCAIRSGGFAYPPMPCRIATKKARDGSGRTLWFEKTGGSQRLRGWVAPKEDGFEVDGEFWCPKGACTERVQARFVRVDGGFDGRLDHGQGGPTTIEMRRAPRR